MPRRECGVEDLALLSLALAYSQMNQLQLGKKPLTTSISCGGHIPRVPKRPSPQINLLELRWRSAIDQDQIAGVIANLLNKCIGLLVYVLFFDHHMVQSLWIRDPKLSFLKDQIRNRRFSHLLTKGPSLSRTDIAVAATFYNVAVAFSEGLVEGPSLRGPKLFGVSCGGFRM